jgi:TonB family protein
VTGALVAGGVALGAGLAAWAAQPGAPTRPDVAADAPATITMPKWVEKPTGADIAKYYPPEALKRGVGGRTVLTCRVGADGRLESCAVAKAEAIGDPSLNMDFGTAALQLALIFRMAPEDRRQAKTAGGVVRIPILWLIPKPHVG